MSTQPSTSQPNTEPLTAQKVYELTSQVLQEHLQLDMSSSDFEVDDIWDVLVAAAVQRLTIETASKLLAGVEPGLVPRST